MVHESSGYPLATVVISVREQNLATLFLRCISHRHLRPDPLGGQTHHRTPLITGAPPEFLEKDFLQTYENKTLSGT